ncbi:MAG: 16S rRNA (cytosine(1402)-N(4))-methyltransferase RsmH [Limisphaerales bacterium]
MDDSPVSTPAPAPHQRRPRYRGTHPRRFEEKYKEHRPDRYADTVAKVLASGKTPAGTHRPIMVVEILEVLAPQPGEVAVDCTLGYGGHAQEILERIRPGGRLLGLDVDPLELPRTEARLRKLGFGPDIFTVHRSNFAGLPQVLGEFFSHSHVTGRTGSPLPAASSDTIDGAHGVTRPTSADIILADLGVSSMQIDDPARGFSVKLDGPLDMRMNPQRGQTASALLEKIKPDAFAALLRDNADEPYADALAPALAGKVFATTRALAAAIRATLPRLNKEDGDLSVRRVFQALRIAVNDEFSALDTFLRHLPACLNPGGRVAILTFHSGEDRRVKKAFAAGLRDGLYAGISHEVIQPTADERHDNPRSAPAKLRWARRAA